MLGCPTNHNDNATGAVFGLPQNENLRSQWIKLSKCQNASALKNSFICEKHFEDRFLKKNEKRCRLNNHLNPVPTIYSDKKPRKPPTERIFQPDQLKEYKEKDAISSFSDINDTLLHVLGKDFHLDKYEDHAVFYKLENNHHSIPEVTVSIYIDSNLKLKLFYKSSPLPLPDWFRKGRNTILTCKSMLENFPSYINQISENESAILDELQEIKFKTSPIYSANLLRHALMVRYTSLSVYKMLRKDYKLPSLSLLKKLVSGKIDPINSVKILKENGSISEDVILLFDEMYLQKCEEYAGGETIGADENGQLYKGVVCFMVIGLKDNVPYVINSIPENEISGQMLKREILNCVKFLHENGFNVRGVVSDDHSSNVSAYKEFLHEQGKNSNDLYITIDGKKLYLFHDSVHLIKNIRNNLLNRRRFIFPSFTFTNLFDDVRVDDGEISWKIFHDVYEKDENLQANMKAAPKLTKNVLHPGSCKQSVPVALAIFDPSTSAAIKKYFPGQTQTANFLTLINTWWTISNSKRPTNTSFQLGDAARIGDRKPGFLRAMANWIEQWDAMKIQNAEKFTLSAQTSSALRRTLRCHAALIEDLLSEGYDFVLTARFESDPIERRFGQYRQMSGGRFLVSLKDVAHSEKILKIKSILKESLDLEDHIEQGKDYQQEISKRISSVESKLGDGIDFFQLSEDSLEVSDYIAGYIAMKLGKTNTGCCNNRLFQNDVCNQDSSYLNILSRGGLKTPSQDLSAHVAHGFAILDECAKDMRNSTVPSRKAGENLLHRFLPANTLACDHHKNSIYSYTNRIITNVFFNNQRKRTTESVVNDRIKSFKKLKREK